MSEKVRDEADKISSEEVKDQDKYTNGQGPNKDDNRKDNKVKAGVVDSAFLAIYFRGISVLRLKVSQLYKELSLLQVRSPHCNATATKMHL